MKVFQLFALLLSFTGLLVDSAVALEKIPFTEDRSIEIIGDDLSEYERQFLKEAVNVARNKFELFFPKVPGNIKLRVNSSKALRAGYNLKDDSIHFPNVKNVIKFGITSQDVINHEAFHLFTCRTFPHTCPEEIGKDENLIQLQEALADFFAYNLNPDTCFGENFYQNQNCVREYENDLLISLTDSPHLQGSALTSYLIKNKITLNQIYSFLKNSEKLGFSLDHLKTLSMNLQNNLDFDLSALLHDQVLEGTYSESRKYWIRENESLNIVFTPNDSLLKKYPNLNISWTSKTGGSPQSFLITESGFNFQVSPYKNAKPEKVIATIKNGTKIIGYRAYYFGMRLSKK